MPPVRPPKGEEGERKARILREEEGRDQEIQRRKPRLSVCRPATGLVNNTLYARSLGDVRFSGPGRGRVYYYY